MLRRGRLFSVRLSDGKTVPASVVDVFPPGSTKQAWYDEMLVSSDTIVVVGYSYDAGATELGLFDFDGSTGAIRHRSTHLLRSNDYYSSRNYASRLVGDKLVFYMPYRLPIGVDGENGAGQPLDLPGLRSFGDKDGDWDRIIEATEIYRPIQPSPMPVLHTVVTCDLGDKARSDLACKATGIVGPYGRTFYVSESAVYVWVTEGHSEGLGRREIAEAPGVVYRLPLDGGAPSALRVHGVPVDQFSFKEGDDGFLNVVVRAEGGGDWMWSPEATGGEIGLLRVPLAGFSTRVGTARRNAYARLPAPRSGWTVQNRFVGDHLVYGSGSSWGQADPERDDRVFLYPYRHGGPASSLDLGHGVDRIEAMGTGAVVIGTDGQNPAGGPLDRSAQTVGNLHFTSIALSARSWIADRFVQPQAAQGELRSHGFFYKPTDEEHGVLGLPVRGAGAPGSEHLIHGSASVLFLEVDDLRFGRLGSLAARPETPDDLCVVSCVD